MAKTRASKGRQARALAVALAALCALLTGASTALAAITPTPSPDPQHETPTQAQALGMNAAHSISPFFTCPDRAVCLFPHKDLTGNYPGGTPVIIFPSVTVSGVWFSFDAWGAGSPHPGSLRNKSGSSIWVYDKQRGPTSVNPRCVPGQSPALLADAYGYFELFYGNPDCSHHYTTPLP